MNKISILPPHEAQKIAAGEVVERPAHIIKELFENAIDAGANSITLRCTQAGKKNIFVADDGSGMTPDDAKLCVHPHATSKITTLNDLTTIHSYGFRGEALASISAVSKVTITTRQKETETGTKIRFEKGEVTLEQDAACPHGTSIEVDDLFYNTPVRKKFLKRDETEWNQIMNLVQAFCLNDRSLNVTVFHNDKLVLNAPGVKTLKDRVAQLWDHNVAQNMLVLQEASSISFDKLRMNDDSPAHPEEHAKGGRLEGLISNHHFWRYNRQQIFFFVNGRYVKMAELSKALLKGYRNVLPPARFPAAFLFITVNPSEVDINVHPKKEEVRFVRPGRITRQLQETVSRTLERNVTSQLESIVPAKSLEDQESATQKTSLFTQPLPNKPQEDLGEIKHNFDLDLFSPPRASNDLPPFPKTLQAADAQAMANRHGGQADGLSELVADTFVTTQRPQQYVTARGGVIKNSKPLAPTTQSNAIPQSKPKVLAQLFSTYILIEKENELIMIDQHAAHERILYEKWMTKFTKKEGTMLMFPLTIHLEPGSIDLILREEQFFADQGIQLRRSSNGTLSVLSSPAGIADNNLEELVREAIAFMQEHEALEQEVFRKKLNEHVHSHLACKSAVKAGDILEEKQIEQLVSDLLEVDNRFICVHGRPTMWTVSKAEIEKKFRRRGP